MEQSQEKRNDQQPVPDQAVSPAESSAESPVPAASASTQPGGSGQTPAPGTRSSRRRRRRRRKAASQAARNAAGSKTPTPSPQPGQPPQAPESEISGPADGTAPSFAPANPGLPQPAAVPPAPAELPTRFEPRDRPPVAPPETPPAWPVEGPAAGAGEEIPAPPEPEPEQPEPDTSSEQTRPDERPGSDQPVPPTQDAGSSDEEQDLPADAAEQARREEIGRTVQMSIRQILDQTPDPEPVPEPEPAPEQPEAEPEPEQPPRLTVRIRNWAVGLVLGVLKWLVLVAVLIGLIAGIGLAWLYTHATEDKLPQLTVQFAGQTLETAAYDWQVPVAGNKIKRSYTETFLEDPQLLTGVVDTATPAVSVNPSGYDGTITILDAEGEQLFAGSLRDYHDFVFSENGEYSATLVVGRRATTLQDAIVTGTQTYRFQFTVDVRPGIRLSSADVNQGQVLGVRVSGMQGDSQPVLTSSDLGDAQFVRCGDLWIAYLGIPADLEPGDYSLQVQAGGYEQTLDLTVHKGNFTARDVSSERRRAQPYLAEIPAQVQAVLDTCDPQLHWTDSGFVQPSLRSLAVVAAYGSPEYVGRTSHERLMNVDNGTARIPLNTVVETRWGDQLICPADGRVLLAEKLAGTAGNTIVIEHGAGVKSIFYGLGSIGVKAGDTVSQGQTIGTTVNETILQVCVGRVPVDPLTVLRNQSDALSLY